MRRVYTFAELGNPAAPGVYAAEDGTRVHLDELAYGRWKSKEFSNPITVKLIHSPEHMGGVIYTIMLV